MSSSRLSQLLKFSKKGLPIRLPQNSNLTIRTQKQVPPSRSPAVNVNVQIIPEWRDDGHVTLEQYMPHHRSESDSHDHSDAQTLLHAEDRPERETAEEHEHHDWGVRVDVEDQSGKNGLTNVDILVDHKASKNEDGDIHMNLIAKVPEKCNVTCHLNQGGNIHISKKMEAEHGFDLYTLDGIIDISKLRGNKIDLTCENGGLIHIKKSCEAQELNVRIGGGGAGCIGQSGQADTSLTYDGSNRLRAKMINVSNANIQVHEKECSLNDPSNHGQLDDDDESSIIDISSVYASQAGDGVHLEVLPPRIPLHPSNKNTDSESIYVEWPRKVRVKSNHGHISIRTATSIFNSSPSTKNDDANDDRDSSTELSHQDALISLGGVNGSFDVALESRGNASTIKSDQKQHTYPMAANIHVDSLSPGQISVLTSDEGHVGLTLDRKIEVDLNILSSPLMNNLDPNVLLEEDQNELVNALIEHDKDINDFYKSAAISNSNNIISIDNEDNDEMNNHIDIKTNAFTGHKSAHLDYVEYVHGTIENKSEEPDSRFDVKTKGIIPKSKASIGKINIERAAGQALESFSGSNNSGFDRPMIAIGTQGNIVVESLSWFGAISRRYKVKEEARDLGRQASIGRNQDSDT